MPHIIENGIVYYQNERVTQHIGSPEKVETIRINDSNVEDITYLFDLELGEYVEQSRAVRAEAIPLAVPSELDLIGMQLVQLDLRLLQGGM